MRKYEKWIHLALSLFTIMLGLFVGLFFALEEPVWVTEKSVLFSTVGTSTILYSTVYFLFRKMDYSRRYMIMGYSITLLLPLFFYLYQPKFDSMEWKDSINQKRQYLKTELGSKPYYSAGYMVENIIESGMGYGKSRGEIILLFGEPTLKKGTVFIYAYFNNFLDGCDRLCFEFEEDTCRKMYVAGCG